MKKLPELVLMILFIFNQMVSGQEKCKSDSLKSAGDLKSALIELKKEMASDPGNSVLLYNFAGICSLEHQNDSCFKYLEAARRTGSIKKILTDPDFLNVRDDKRWDDLENFLITEMKSEKGNPITDIEYAKALWRLMAVDQAYFCEITIAIRNLGIDSPVVYALQRLKLLLNEKNQDELELLISAKGWPKYSEVGPEAGGAAFYIIQHSNGAKQEKYLRLLESRCNEKEASWIHYAMLYDRNKMNSGLPQKYGTQMVLNNKESGKFELYQLEDKSKVNYWRAEVGLPPLDLK